MSKPAPPRLGLIILALALPLSLFVLWTSLPGREVPQAGRMAGAAIGGDFTLTDHQGRRVTAETYGGSWRLMYFGYSFCPDICPTELQVMVDALERLPERLSAEVQPLFVSVDPERDTPEHLAGYVSLFHPRLIGLTGSPEEVEAVKRAWKVYAARAEEGAGDEYLVNHSSFIYLMDPENRPVEIWPMNTAPERIAGRITELVEAGSGAGG